MLTPLLAGVALLGAVLSHDALAEDSGWVSPCQALEVRDTTPRLHTELSPLDLQPLAVMLAEKPCTFPDSYELLFYQRFDDADPALLTSTTVVAEEVPPSTAFALPLDLQLEPNTRYRFLVRRIEAEGYDALAQIDLLTSEALTQGYAGAPSAPALSVAWSYRTEEGDYRVQVGGTVAPVADPDDLSVLQLVREDAPEVVVETAPVYGTLPVGVVGSWVQDKRPSEVCLVAYQIDAAGRESARSAPGCVEVERGQCEGCGGGAAPSLAAALAGALLAARRRRRR